MRSQVRDRCKLAAQLHRHQGIKSQIRQAIMRAGGSFVIAPEHPNNPLAHEVTQQVDALARKRLREYCRASRSAASASCCRQGGPASV